MDELEPAGEAHLSRRPGMARRVLAAARLVASRLPAAGTGLRRARLDLSRGRDAGRTGRRGPVVHRRDRGPAHHRCGRLPRTPAGDDRGPGPARHSVLHLPRGFAVWGRAGRVLLPRDSGPDRIARATQGAQRPFRPAGRSDRGTRGLDEE